MTAAIPNAQNFIKRIDTATGKFYHVTKTTNESTWETPHGETIPLAPISPKIVQQLQEEREIADYQRRQERKERRELIQKAHALQIKCESKKRKETLLAEEERIDNLWKEACDMGQITDGFIQFNWKNIGHVSDRIYNFELDYNISLKQLSLCGNGLVSIEDIPQCQNVEKLTLASNSIPYLHPSIGKMNNLIHLNLVRNNLEKLPYSIGDLMALQSLELANNSLSTLPETIGNLVNIQTLNLECNKLKTLPKEIGNMNCRVINVNSNQLMALPQSIGEITQLESLLANDNNIKFLPTDICNSSSLRVIHLSRNYIMELPASIGNITSLECLWLDYNQLSALPPGFQNLINLFELKMEGNVSMVRPTMDVIRSGVKQVLKWCELRLASSDLLRQKSIVLSLQSLLEQVGHYRVCGLLDGREQPHESIYEANVEYEGDKYYQFPLPMLWSVFIPSMEKIWASADQDKLKSSICSFPYDRQEVEKVLFQFQDAGGLLTHRSNQANFRKCCCVDSQCNKKVCVPPKYGWMCERSAILVRMNVILENDMEEKRRKTMEEKRLEEAYAAAERQSTIYMKTEEVKTIVNKLAKERVAKDSLEIKEPSNDKSKKKSLLKKKYINKLKAAEASIREEYISAQIESRQNAAVETNDKMRKVLEKWLGLGTEDVFHSWKNVIFDTKNTREKLKNDKSTAETIRENEEMAKHERATNELQYWRRGFDEFNEKPCWTNIITNELTHDEPTVKSILSSGRLSRRSTKPLVERHDKTKDNINLPRESTSKSTVGADKEVILAASRILEMKRKIIQNRERRKDTVT